METTKTNTVMKNSLLPDKFEAKGKSFSRSSHHPEMWVITLPDGKFYTISCSDNYIRETYLK
jgi:hypothetical protein